MRAFEKLFIFFVAQPHIFRVRELTEHFILFSRQLMLFKLNNRINRTGITVIIAQQIISKIIAMKLQVSLFP